MLRIFSADTEACDRTQDGCANTVREPAWKAVKEGIISWVYETGKVPDKVAVKEDRSLIRVVLYQALRCLSNPIFTSHNLSISFFNHINDKEFKDAIFLFKAISVNAKVHWNTNKTPKPYHSERN